MLKRILIAICLLSLSASFAHAQLIPDSLKDAVDSAKEAAETAQDAVDTAKNAAESAQDAVSTAKDD